MPLQSTRGAASAKAFGFTAGAKDVILSNIILVAGGASGCSAGGGAGGYRNITTLATLTLKSGTSFPVQVGAGGAGGPAGSVPAASRNGTPSYFNVTTLSTGGGRGDNGPIDTAQPGGSGGGSYGASGRPAGSGNAGGFSPPEGNPGASSPQYAGGGGGGAGSAGNPGGPFTQPGGPGGSGVDVGPILGAAPQPFYGPTGSTIAGGGGGGGGNVGSNGGPGGGGAGTTTGVPSQAGSGVDGAGAGGGGNYGTGNGGDGGDGVVFIKAPSTVNFTLTPPSNTVTTVPGPSPYKVAKFNVTGTLTAS